MAQSARGAGWAHRSSGTKPSVARSNGGLISSWLPGSRGRKLGWSVTIKSMCRPERKAREPIEDLAENRREIVRCERLIVRSIAGVVEELCQHFPEDLCIDGSEDTEDASACQQVEQSGGTSKLELPWRTEGGPSPVLDRT